MIVILVLCLVTQNIMVVSIKVNILSIASIVLGIIIVGRYSCRITNWGVRAILDIMFDNSVLVEGTIIACTPFRASSLTDSRTKEGTISRGFYYIVQVKRGEETINLLSTAAILPAHWENCHIDIGKFSSVILSIRNDTEADSAR